MAERTVAGECDEQPRMIEQARHRCIGREESRISRTAEVPRDRGACRVAIEELDKLPGRLAKPAFADHQRDRSCCADQVQQIRIGGNQRRRQANAGKPAVELRTDRVA